MLQLFGVVCPIELLHTQLIQASGIFLAVVGVVATFFAQREMGASWRIGVDPSETTTLVRDGVFAIVRNPIFSAMLIFAAGITLMAPNPLAVAGFLLLFTAIELQVRRVEEGSAARIGDI
ncbi:isoprenylcysteine carboxylmethyltransferase family protein [Mycobacterium sp. 20KCMC460]|uniref:methyltransferase family protein n=1 Tax=Mycobacterium sp. 20KCMC460 TaxID=2903536 RepID=UPI00351D91C6